MSAVFSDVAAHQVLHPRQTRGDMTVQLDRQLLAAWLELRQRRGQPRQRRRQTGDGQPDTTFGEAITADEATRLDDAASRADLEAHKDALEAINHSDDT